MVDVTFVMPNEWHTKNLGLIKQQSINHSTLSSTIVGRTYIGRISCPSSTTSPIAISLSSNMSYTKDERSSNGMNNPEGPWLRWKIARCISTILTDVYVCPLQTDPVRMVCFDEPTIDRCSVVHSVYHYNPGVHDMGLPPPESVGVLYTFRELPVYK